MRGDIATSAPRWWRRDGRVAPVDCFAQKATWTTVKPLFDEAARSFDVK